MNKGFTLLELVVVIGVIGVLSATSIMILNPDTHLKRSRDSRRKTDLQQIRSALELYRSDNGTYPATTNWVFSTAGDSWIPGLTPNYLKTIPIDPKNSGSDYTGQVYGYNSSSWCSATPGVSYILSVTLEDPNDSDKGQRIRYNTCEWGSASLYSLTNP